MALSMRFLSSRLSFRWIVFLVDNRFYLLVQIGLPYNSGIDADADYDEKGLERQD
jgi:hypothetical protein